MTTATIANDEVAASFTCEQQHNLLRDVRQVAGFDILPIPELQQIPASLYLPLVIACGMGFERRCTLPNLSKLRIHIAHIAKSQHQHIYA